MTDLLRNIHYAAQKSDEVHINSSKIYEFVTHVSDRQFSSWLHDSSIDFSRLSEEEFLEFLLILHSISFCYWGDIKWTVEYRGIHIMEHGE
jgi:hypothetical protein